MCREELGALVTMQTNTMCPPEGTHEDLPEGPTRPPRTHPAQPTRPGPGQILEIWESGNPNVSDQQKVLKWKEILKIQKPCRPKCRQGLNWSTKNIPAHLWPSHSTFCMDQTNQQQQIQKDYYFPWWVNEPYSPRLGPCCYPPEVGK